MIQRKRILTWLLSMLVLLPVAAAAQGYRISPGDVLRIEVIEDEALNRSVLVDPQGRISFPLAGTILVRGKTVTAVQATLVANLTPNFAAPPSVFVALERLAPTEPRIPDEPETISIYVLGEVERPGKVDMEPGTTLLQAFAAMGGFSNFAATKRVQLRRTDPKTGVESVTTLNYKAMSQGLSTNATLKLHDGDVILVPTRRLFE
ncbi:polysaccharide biosynthesis/export family protein [uncultured Tateyamaria sp.]|uniref:polysaccharide biosynthesis/export family protein n=1 Tax=uncultured Tateyamaria sp. TaxID=455651 RepID=UPI00262E251A|nr:polysaccharide biosynthesis/export family protein [uncultured Tateyamaria sp.]